MLSQLENRSTQPTLTASPAQLEPSSSLAPSHRRSTVNSHRQPQHGHPDDNLKHQPRGSHQQHQTPVEPRLQSMSIYVNKNVSLKSFLHFLPSNCGFTLRTSINFIILFLNFFSTVDGNTNYNNKNYINYNDKISKKSLESHLFSYKRIFGATTKIEPPSRPLSSWDDPTFKPYFDDNNVDNVTTQLGKTAHLHCKIRQLGDRTVRTID
ncbi:uncharacterized protein LOC107359412 [Tetranychus urticae]|uniref:uncharacterized protein LOC107359412 n=1 Tax=Tetranychus urticae TaxID=32264 RepID=UPI000D64AF86|nr:uncharacterized protein LOC107359412 [Tetranychus urticae]